MPFLMGTDPKNEDARDIGNNKNNRLEQKIFHSWAFKIFQNGVGRG